MKTLELFSGTGSFSKVAKELGHETFTIDNGAEHNPDVCTNCLKSTGLYQILLKMQKQKESNKDNSKT